MAAPIREISKPLGQNKGMPRLWLEGKWLARAGFLPGLFLAISTSAQGLELRPTTAPTSNRVAGKAGGEVAVIDLNNARLRELFGDGAELHIRVEADRIIVRRGVMAERIAARPRDGSAGSAFSGAGLMDRAARNAGFTPRWAVEVEQEYADIFAENEPDCAMYNCSIHEALFLNLPSVEFLSLGICCQPFSNATRLAPGGKTKVDKDAPMTAHPLGDMSYFALALIAAVNPRTVLVENAPRYATSETGVGLMGALRRLGYHVDCRVISPSECGFLARRARTVIVAQTPEADGSVRDPFPAPDASTTTVADILDAEVPESAFWDRASKPWVFNHADRHAERGNGFAKGTVVSPDATVIPTFKAGYLKEQGDGARLAHPTRPETYRWFSLAEIRRVMGVPEDFFTGASRRVSGETLGQGVHIPLFTRIIARATGREREAAPTVATTVTTLTPEAITAEREQGDLFAA